MSCLRSLCARFAVGLLGLVLLYGAGVAPLSHRFDLKSPAASPDGRPDRSGPGFGMLHGQAFVRLAERLVDDPGRPLVTAELRLPQVPASAAGWEPLWLAGLLVAGAAGFCLGQRRGGPELRTQIGATDPDGLWRAALAELPVGLVIASAPEGTAVFRNARAEQLLDGAVDTSGTGLRGFRSDGSPYAPDDWPVRRSLATGEVVEGEAIDVLRNDGRCLELEAGSAPIRDAAGRIVAAVAVFHDIGRYRRTEAALREGEALYRALLDHSPVGAVIIDAETLGFPAFNDRACLQLGYRREEFAGLTLPDIEAQFSRERLRAKIRSLDREREPCQFETRHRGKDGVVRDVLVTTQRLRLDGRHYLYAILQDITERKQTGAALRRSEERLRLAQRAANAGVWDWDMVTGALAWSDETYRLFGWEPGSLEPNYRHWLDAVHPEDRERVQALVRALLEDGEETFRVEYRIVRADGAVRWLEDRGQVMFDARRRPVRVLGINIDITDRKRAEENLREADRRKNEFLAMLAHELRNPLAPIRNAVELWRRLGLHEPRLDWARDVVDRQIANLTRLVDDLLDVSRITQGKITLRREICEFGAIVEQAVETSRPHIEARGHRLRVHLPDTRVEVEGDRTRLVQIIGNLLNNAAKFTENGGLIELDVETAPHEVRVRVRDNGMGIPAELLGDVFEPFIQGDQSLARVHGGLGVGLMLVKRLAELHGGGVAAHSAGVGQGAEFRVWLPRVVMSG
jgi:PAS domain S-box-containing protein